MPSTTTPIVGGSIAMFVICIAIRITYMIMANKKKRAEACADRDTLNNNFPPPNWVARRPPLAPTVLVALAPAPPAEPMNLVERMHEVQSLMLQIHTLEREPSSETNRAKIQELQKKVTELGVVDTDTQRDKSAPAHVGVGPAPVPVPAPVPGRSPAPDFWQHWQRDGGGLGLGRGRGSAGPPPYYA